MTDIDKHIGRQLRAARKEKRLTLAQVGAGIGVTLQNVATYEAGSSRISAARLYDLSMVLDVTPAFFYDGYGP